MNTIASVKSSSTAPSDTIEFGISSPTAYGESSKKTAGQGTSAGSAEPGKVDDNPIKVPYQEWINTELSGTCTASNNFKALDKHRDSRTKMLDQLFSQVTGLKADKPKDFSIIRHELGPWERDGLRLLSLYDGSATASEKAFRRQLQQACQTQEDV